jgi:hypothetical protein
MSRLCECISVISYDRAQPLDVSRALTFAEILEVAKVTRG